MKAAIALDHAMITAHDIDPTFIDALMGAEADSLYGAGFGERSSGPLHSRNAIAIGTSIPAPGLSTWRSRAVRLVPSGLVAAAPQACRAGPDVSGGNLLPARSLHPTRPFSRSFNTRASAATNVWGRPSSGRLRNASTYVGSGRRDSVPRVCGRSARSSRCRRRRRTRRP